MATLGSGGVDRISGLPDDLLHCILIRLRSTRAAARTSVLSRRWRRVWAHLPELHLFYSAASARTHDRVDAALAASSAPAINHLEITASYLRTPRRLCRVPARRVSGWLRLASQRNLAGSLRLDVPYVLTDDDDDEDEDPVLLPVCDRATSIILELCRHKLRIIQVGGASFMALNTLTIWRARMDIQELEDVISSRCPNLKDLNLKSIVLKGGPRLSIRSDSLEQIEIRTSFQDTVEIAAPNLQKLTQVVSGDAYIAAPMLSELCWEGYFQPSRHHIIGPRRHLRRLNISINGLSNTLLMQQFDTVDELTLKIFDLKGTEQYERFLSEISRLSKCKVLVVELFNMGDHAIEPTMLCLLRKCAGVTKIVVQYSDYRTDYQTCKSSACPCNHPENRKKHNFALDSLEEVEVRGYGEIVQKMRCVELLYELCANSPKKVGITISEIRWREYARQRINTLFPSNDKVRVTIQSIGF